MLESENFTITPYLTSYFKEKENRTRTFIPWKTGYPHITKLVESGFIYHNNNFRKDLVQCHHCGILIYSWENSDNPDEEHLLENPNCTFIRKKINRHKNKITNEFLENGKKIQEHLKKLVSDIGAVCACLEYLNKILVDQNPEIAQKIAEAK